MTFDLCVLCQSFSVPLEILEEIFLNLPPDQVVHRCRLVCRQWKEVADSQSLWKGRCRREGYHLRDASKAPHDWRLFYFLCKKRRNLLKNPRAEGVKKLSHELRSHVAMGFSCEFLYFTDRMRGWQILENSGDRWRVEGVMVAHPDENVQKNFVTSYG